MKTSMHSETIIHGNEINGILRYQSRHEIKMKTSMHSETMIHGNEINGILRYQSRQEIKMKTSMHSETIIHGNEINSQKNQVSAITASLQLVVIFLLCFVMGVFSSLKSSFCHHRYCGMISVVAEVYFSC